MHHHIIVSKLHRHVTKVCKGPIPFNTQELKSRPWVRGRCLSSCSKNTPPLSPSEAGKRSFEARLELDRSNNNNNNNNSINATSTAKKMASMGTLLSHAGLSTSMDPTMQNEALCPPIHLETTYTRPPSGDYNSAGEGGKGWVYSRMGNPTRNELEKVITILETFGGTKDISSDYTTTTTNNNNKSMDSNALIESTVSCAFSSGMAAVSSIILATLSQNQLHIILPDDIYHGVPSQLKTTFIEQGVTYSSVDMTNIQQIEKEVESIIHGNIIVWMESPSNPLCKVTDIQTVCDWVKETREVETNEEKKIVTVVDSTWAPPCITQPLHLGADAVLHSGTKYLAGHSDVLLGCITTSPFTEEGKALGAKIRSIQSAIGATASPFDCWLTLRGLRTLHIRLERQCKNAFQLAEFLSRHSLVKAVHYPGLANHPQHDVALSQMKDDLFGGMLSFEVSNETMAMAVAGAVCTIKRATSLGGTETLIEHRASIEPDDGRVSPPGLLRMSVGLEDCNDLIQDLETALKIAGQIVK